MKNIINLILLIACITTLSSCGKGGGGGGVTPPKEENIAFTTDAVNGYASPSNYYNFNVTLTSVMPAQGIKIEITATDDVSGTAITPQNAAVPVSTVTTPVSVINLPLQKWVDVTVKVSSVATPTNNASSQPFKVVYK